jgi:hypothetical protein
MKNPNNNSEKAFENQQANTGDNNTNIQNNHKIFSLFFPCYLWTSLNISSSERDAKLLDDEDFFKWRYGVAINEIQRKHIIEFKNSNNLTNEAIRLGLKTQQISVTNDGIKIHLRREMLIIGNILFLILLLITTCSILNLHNAGITPNALMFGYLLFLTYCWGTAFYLRKFLIDPVRKLEECGLRNSFFATSAKM